MSYTEQDTSSTEWMKNIVYIPVDWQGIKERKRRKEIQALLDRWNKQ